MAGIKILSDATATGAPDTGTALNNSDCTFQAVGSTTSGTGAAVVDIEVSNNGTDWLQAGTISLTLGTTATTDGLTVTPRWAFTRAKVISISGTGAKVSVWVGA